MGLHTTGIRLQNGRHLVTSSRKGFSMRVIFLFIFSVFLPATVIAQQSPPPPGDQATPAPVGEQMGQIVFDVLERKAIETFYSRLPANTAGEVIRDVVNSATQDQSAPSNSEQDEQAQNQKNGKSKKNKNKAKGKGNGKDKSKKMPPGLAKRKSLPPGLQKQLDKNGTLPPGLAKRELPTELERLLPPAREGTERVVAGNDVVLIHQATGVVLDILKDIIIK